MEDAERDDREQDSANPLSAHADLQQQDQRQRPENVELFLGGEGPEVTNAFWRKPAPRLQDVREVDHSADATDQARSEGLPRKDMLRGEKRGRHDEVGGDYDNERWK